MYRQLFNKGLSGPIPSTLSNLSNLKLLYLYGNQLSGSIPEELSNLNKLESLYLQSNQLSGNIPASTILRMPNLVELYLSSNKFGGNIPDLVGNLTTLQSLDLSGNMLTGFLPDFQNMAKLKSIDLSSNQLYGNISYVFGTLRSLQQVNLSFNHFSGEIPSSFVYPEPGKSIPSADFRENCLNVPFANMSTATLMLLPQSSTCSQSTLTDSPTSTPPSDSGSHSEVHVPIIFGASVVIIVFTCVAVISFAIWRRRRQRNIKQSRGGKIPSANIAASALADSEAAHTSTRVTIPDQSTTGNVMTTSTESSIPQGAHLSRDSTILSTVVDRSNTVNSDSSNITATTEKSLLFDGIGGVSDTAVASGRRQDMENLYMNEKLNNDLRTVTITERTRDSIESNLVREFGLPSLWDHGQVMEWVRQKSFEDDVVKSFEEHAVDGSILPSFVTNPNILKEEYGISNFITRAKIIQSIEITQLAANRATSSQTGIGSSSLCDGDNSEEDLPPPAYE
ncbi:hypothetical protein HDU76_003024 [Blyttiomyces sp. JEL0837]|nr:hypothetical protein HDU76_003024 [Blyttiomyces sp. JEL0837]